MLLRSKIKYLKVASVFITMRYVTLILLLASLYVLDISAKPRLKRICASTNGINTIQWLVNPDTCQELVKIEIYGRENSFAPFKLIATLTSGSQNEYDHSNGGTFQKGHYYLRYIITCSGSPVEKSSDTLEVDVRAPDAIDPDSVSVINGKSVIGWSRSTAPDSKSYVIYRTIASNNFPIDTVYGQANTFYRDSSIGSPTWSSERYKIAAVDSCNNISPIGNFHETVYLTYAVDSCKKELYLSWTPYTGWAAGVAGYDVYIADSTGFRKLHTVSSTKDTLRNLETQVVYRIFVRAIKKGGGATSSSNTINPKVDFGDVMDHLYITTVTYKSDKLFVQWLASPHSGLHHFEIWRGRDKEHLIKIVELPPSISKWEDGEGAQGIWYYRINAFNTCGNILRASNISNSIVLASAIEGTQRVLRWNPYNVWLNGVARYEVYRIVYGMDTTNLFPIGTTDKQTTFFIDPLPLAEDTFPGACYFIKAVESGINKLGVRGESLSRLVCYANPPLVYIPNAFAPYEHLNTHFKPSLVNVDLASSSMLIYNRWGQVIAGEVNLLHGWDGRMGNGKVAPEGVYFYQLTVRGIDGSIRTYKGTLTLL